jgi:hypothetical protein
VRHAEFFWNPTATIRDTPLAYPDLQDAIDHDRWALDHPIRRMAQLGMRLHPNSDDPTLHDVTPGGAWELMYSHLGFTISDLRAMMLNGIDASWADVEARASWAREWPAEFDALAGAADWVTEGAMARVIRLAWGAAEPAPDDAYQMAKLCMLPRKYAGLSTLSTMLPTSTCSPG